MSQTFSWECLLRIFEIGLILQLLRSLRKKFIFLRIFLGFYLLFYVSRKRQSVCSFIFKMLFTTVPFVLIFYVIIVIIILTCNVMLGSNVSALREALALAPPLPPLPPPSSPPPPISTKPSLQPFPSTVPTNVSQPFLNNRWTVP
jgi:hypothetical protein